MLNRAVVESLPQDIPVVMLNLVRFRARSREGDGTGRDAYQRYSRLVMPLIKARGGTVLWGGEAKGIIFGDMAGTRWDYVALVQYPSVAAFRDMMTSPAYAEANVHRENGLEGHVIIATAETYSKMTG